MSWAYRCDTGRSLFGKHMFVSKFYVRRILAMWIIQNECNQGKNPIIILWISLAWNATNNNISQCITLEMSESMPNKCWNITLYPDIVETVTWIIRSMVTVIMILTAVWPTIKDFFSKFQLLRLQYFYLQFIDKFFNCCCQAGRLHVS